MSGKGPETSAEEEGVGHREQEAHGRAATACTGHTEAAAWSRLPLIAASSQGLLSVSEIQERW
jgi:hypothetical protein